MPWATPPTTRWFNDRLAAVIDPLGHRVTMLHAVVNDGSRRLQSYITPAGRYTLSYGSNSQLSAIKDELGNQVNQTWGASANRTVIQDTSGQQWNYAYDSLNRLRRVQTPLSSITTFLYSNWQRQAMTDALGARVTSTYGSTGRLRNVATPLIL